jgi:hypothetical protein
MEMDFDQFLIPYRQKAVSLKMFGNILCDCILIQILSLDEELCVITKFQHNLSSSYS